MHADPAWQPVVTSALLRLRPLTRWQPEAFAKYFESGLACQGALVAEDAVTGEVIGSSRYIGHDLLARSVEIGYTFLVRSRWGGPFNRELKRLMLEHAFGVVDSVWFVVGEKNWRSRRAMVKIGGVLVPTEEAPPTDRAPGRVFYRILKP